MLLGCLKQMCDSPWFRTKFTKKYIFISLYASESPCCGTVMTDMESEWSGVVVVGGVGLWLAGIPGTSNLICVNRQDRIPPCVPLPTAMPWQLFKTFPRLGFWVQPCLSYHGYVLSCNYFLLLDTPLNGAISKTQAPENIVILSTLYFSFTQLFASWCRGKKI